MDAMKFNPDHRIILIDIPESSLEYPVYEAVRCAWRMSRKNAEAADYILAMAGGVCRGAYVAETWKTALTKDFPRLDRDITNRIGFVGNEAPPEIWGQYVAKRLPDSLARKRGHQTPFRYLHDGREGVANW